jgi:Spy/CpxP family protein refolding chaperone
MWNDPRLYAMAKITLDAGSHTRTHAPWKQHNQNEEQQNSQIHSTGPGPRRNQHTGTMPARERKQLLKIIQSKGFDKALVDVVAAVTSQIKKPIRVAVSR